MKSPVQVLIVEEQFVARECFRRLLEGEPDFQVVGVAHRLADAAWLLAATRPDLVLLGTGAGSRPSLATLGEFQALAPGVRVLVVGETAEPVSDVLVAGGRGVLGMQASPEELFKALRTVAAGQCWVGCETVDALVQSLRDHATRLPTRPRDTNGLTARERQVAAGVARGESNREIATRLGLSEATVKGHLTPIFARLRLANRAELAAWATRQGLGDEPLPESNDSGSSL